MDVLLQINFYSPLVRTLFTYELMCLCVEGALVSEYRPMCLDAREHGSTMML